MNGPKSSLRERERDSMVLPPSIVLTLGQI
jgi:hypothetical protein